MVLVVGSFFVGMKLNRPIPTSTDMASRDKAEKVKKTSLQCAAFEESKLQYKFDQNNALTWDNAFPSREDWANRLKIFKKATDTPRSVSGYTIEKHDLAFDYPEGWDVFVNIAAANSDNYRPEEYQIIFSNPGDQLIRPMVIKVNMYEGAPDVASEWTQGNYSNNLVLTKAGLIQKKKQIESAVRTADDYGKFVVFGNDYSTSEYHNFYRHAEFFVGNNLVTIIQPLSVVVPDITGYGKEHQELLSKINSGFVSELVSAEIKLADLVAASFRQNSIYPGD